MLYLDSTVKFHLDNQIKDGTSLFFQRSLTQVLAKSYDVLYADLQARSLFPVSNEVNEGATTLKYRVYDRVGLAKFIGGYAKDLPRADAFGKEVTSPLKVSGVSFGYNTEEIRNAQFAGQPLEQRKANAARRATEELFDDTAWFGDADTGLPGFLTNPNITTTTVVDGAGGDSEWSTKTPDEILDDVNDLFGDIFESTLMKEKPNTLLLPVSQWSFISSTRLATGTDTTILQYIVNNSPYIASADDIKPVNELNGAGTAGADIMVAYDKNPDKLQFHIPMEQKFLPVQMKGLEFIIPSEAKTGGVVIYYPASVSIGEGI